MRALNRGIRVSEGRSYADIESEMMGIRRCFGITEDDYFDSASVFEGLRGCRFNHATMGSFGLDYDVKELPKSVGGQSTVRI